MNQIVSIVDYGLGNILSISRAVANVGFDFKLVNTPDEICASDYLLLPGVGSFHRGMSELKSRNLVDPIKEYFQSGKPLLGICLGMQLFFDQSEEGSKEVGFGFISGRVVRVVPRGSLIKVPHIGWSRLKGNDTISDKSNQDIEIIRKADNQFVYFVHSYHPCVESKYLLASTYYQNCAINALVRKDNIIGCQFHPEKSGKLGAQLLRMFLNIRGI